MLGFQGANAMVVISYRISNAEVNNLGECSSSFSVEASDYLDVKPIASTSQNDVLIIVVLRPQYGRCKNQTI